MLSKEHGVIVGVAILLDNWLYGPERRPYPVGLWIGLAIVTAGFLAAWLAIGRAGASDVAAVFIGRGPMGRLAVALPAVARAAWLLVWPASPSADYGPQVIPVRTSLSLAAGFGALAVVAVPLVALLCRRRAPAVAFAAALAALSYLPTSNLLSASGVVLVERNLYLAVALIGLGDTAAAAPLLRRARTTMPDERIALRAQFLLDLARGGRPGALAVADSARRRYLREESWYVSYSQ
jgi:hypothetical protein